MSITVERKLITIERLDEEAIANLHGHELKVAIAECIFEYRLIRDALKLARSVRLEARKALRRAKHDVEAQDRMDLALDAMDDLAERTNFLKRSSSLLQSMLKSPAGS